MTNIRSLEKLELIKRTQDLVVLERGLTLELIEYLREIERRLLFLEMEYSSLFEFSVKHLGLSEGSAQRRISAMRLIRDIPEAKNKIASGEISLSNASQIQSVFRVAKSSEQSNTGTTQKMSIDEKKEILEKISGMTQRQCQNALLELVPEAAPKFMERDRQISEERFELKLVVSKDLYDQIEELKLLLSHTLGDGGTSELLKYLVEGELKRQEKKLGLSLNSRPENQQEVPAETSRKDQAITDQSNDQSTPPSAQTKGSNFTAAAVRTKVIRSRKHISNTIRRAIWKRAQGCCEAMDLTGRCMSRYRLELDHIIPYSRGGADTVENLRLCCRAHNFKHAIKAYGAEVMGRYRD